MSDWIATDPGTGDKSVWYRILNLNSNGTYTFAARCDGVEFEIHGSTFYWTDPEQEAEEATRKRAKKPFAQWQAECADLLDECARRKL